MQRRVLLSLLLYVLLGSLIPAYADTVVVGLPADTHGYSDPFGSAYNHEYQQVYINSLFSGPITITELEFYNTKQNSGATAMPSGNWSISLSTTSHNWNTLSNTFAANIGTDNTAVFNGNLSQSWAFGNTLTIILSTPFTYNPANGNLLMDVVGSGITTSVPIYFDANGNGGGNTIMGRVFSFNSSGGLQNIANPGYGLVTGFSTNTVPEPASMLLLGLGLVWLAGVRRKLRK